MPIRQQQKKTYQTFQGKKIDMDTLRQRNELTPAVGNARVNARGDELGPGGKIIKKRDDVIRDYYEEHPQAAPDEVAQVEQPVEEVAEPVQTKAQKKSTENAKKAKAAEKADAEDGWVEDADGNFVKRGD
ncbi:MAG: hypothetical protein CMD92_09340 [Gammaproteobacteria bacterium]|nr:hypothetical protein [Gammaproteobacteria bacterium]|tara:strand:+ start:21317 stop:21706 length:390 start_codon:yes stop_codon:yes gene_type:complete